MAEKLKFGNNENKEINELISEMELLKFEENDEASKKLLKQYYKNIEKKTLTRDQEIMLITRWHHQREFAGYLIGYLFFKRKKKIDEDKILWYNKKLEVMPDFFSINEYFDTYAEQLPFKKAQMYNYIDMAEHTTIDEFLKFGISKASYVAKVKDEVVQKKLKTQLNKNPQLTLSQLDQTAQKLFNKTKEKKKEEKREKEKEINKTYTFNLKVNGEDEIIIKSKTKEDRDNLVKALNYYEQAIKNYLSKCE